MYSGFKAGFPREALIYSTVFRHFSIVLPAYPQTVSLGSKHPRDERFIMSESVIHRRTVTVINEQGLHFRPCQLIALAAQQHQSSVILSRGKTRADAKSLLELLTLAAEQGTNLELEVAGPDAIDVLNEVTELFSCGFQSPPRAV